MRKVIEKLNDLCTELTIESTMTGDKTLKTVYDLIHVQIWALYKALRRIEDNYHDS